MDSPSRPGAANRPDHASARALFTFSKNASRRALNALARAAALVDANGPIPGFDVSSSVLWFVARTLQRESDPAASEAALVRYGRRQAGKHPRVTAHLARDTLSTANFWLAVAAAAAETASSAEGQGDTRFEVLWYQARALHRETHPTPDVSLMELMARTFLAEQQATRSHRQQRGRHGDER